MQNPCGNTVALGTHFTTLHFLCTHDLGAKLNLMAWTKSCTDVNSHQSSQQQIFFIQKHVLIKTFLKARCSSQLMFRCLFSSPSGFIDFLTERTTHVLSSYVTETPTTEPPSPWHLFFFHFFGGWWWRGVMCYYSNTIVFLNKQA